MQRAAEHRGSCCGTDMKVGQVCLCKSEQKCTLHGMVGRPEGKCYTGGSKTSSFQWGLQRWGWSVLKTRLCIINSDVIGYVSWAPPTCQAGSFSLGLSTWGCYLLWAPVDVGQQDPAVWHSHFVSISDLGSLHLSHGCQPSGLLTPCLVLLGTFCCGLLILVNNAVMAWRPEVILPQCWEGLQAMPLPLSETAGKDTK
jgi:hypothetical protein